MIKKLFKLVKLSTLTKEEKYLAASCDLVELERRQNELQRGSAPWQAVANKNLRGWV